MSFRVSKPNPTRTPSASSSCSSTCTPEDTILQHIDDVINIDHALPKPKVLKSCIRCRKHKTKCDAFERQPAACSTCQRKGMPCKIDSVLPPQRTDNIKTIVQQVSSMKEEYHKLEMTYGTIFHLLGLEFQDFDTWRESKKSHETSESEDEEPFCLLKLSDESFISLNLVDSEKLLINNEMISIPDLERKLRGLVKRLNFLYGALAPDSTLSSLNYESDTQSQSSSSSESSVASPRSYTTSSHTLPPDSSSPLRWFDIDFHVSELFRVNKLLLILLISFYYPSDALSQRYTVFLSDYLNSFYQIIETQNKSLNSSTYSNILLNTIIPGCSVFDKAQLRDLVDADVFNSDVYLKRLTQILFLNVLLFGIDDNLTILTDFVRFVEGCINLNRKKINFDKSCDLRFIEGMMKLFKAFMGPSGVKGDLQDGLSVSAASKRRVREEYQVYLALMKMDSSIYDDGASLTVERINMHTLKKQFKRWIQMWEGYLALYKAEENIFMDDFTLELMLVNCLILINEGFQEFNGVLVEFLTSHKLTSENENVAQLIRAFKEEDGVEFGSVQLSCEQMKNIVLEIAGKKSAGVIELKMNDIQVILENVDWKSESTDEVLKKIGVI